MIFNKEQKEDIEWIKSIIGEDIDEYEALEAVEEIDLFMMCHK